MGMLCTPDKAMLSVLGEGCGGVLLRVLMAIVRTEEENEERKGNHSENRECENGCEK